MKMFTQYLRDLYGFSRRKFIGILLFTILDGLMGGISIVMLIPLLAITGIVGESTLSLPFLSSLLQRLSGLRLPIQLLLILSVYMALILLQSAVSRKTTILNAEIVQGYSKHLRVSLYQNLVEAEWSCFAGKKKAHITNALTNEIQRIGSGTVFFLRILSQVIVAAFQLVVAFMLSVPLSLFVLVCGLLVLRLMNSTFKESKKLGGSLLRINQNLMTQIREQLDGVKEAKSYGTEAAQVASFAQTAEQTRRNVTDFTKLQSKTVFLYNIVAALVICLIFFSAMVFLSIPPSSLLIIVYIFARLWPSFKSLQSNLQNVIAMLPSYASLQALTDDLQVHTEKIYTGTAAVSLPADAAIRFENVGFQYGEAEGFALQNLNFEIPAKKMTAFVGQSGAGKSTIVDLLIGLLKPTQGRITAGDVPIDETTLHAWRKSVAYVPQDPFLFNGTIAENLLRYTPDASPAAIEDALQRAAAYDFVQHLPDGMETVIGDSGVRLSGGERQRIVLARALLRNPQYLILDEATSSLDTENEQRIQKAVDSLAGRLTVILIAHRLSTVRNADNILVVRDGHITEQGTWDTLLQNKDGFLARSLEIRS